MTSHTRIIAYANMTTHKESSDWKFANNVALLLQHHKPNVTITPQVLLFSTPYQKFHQTSLNYLNLKTKIHNICRSFSEYNTVAGFENQLTKIYDNMPSRSFPLAACFCTEIYRTKQSTFTYTKRNIKEIAVNHLNCIKWITGHCT